jgi:hypothetical protein
MTTIPQVARAMRDILTTTAVEAARATRCVQRTSPLGGATFSQTLAVGFLAHPRASLEEWAQTAAALGVSITPQALDQRCPAAAASCLEQGLKAALTQVIAAEPVAIPLLARCPAVSRQDSSTIVLPEARATVWHGCGGNTPSRTSAARTLQVRLARRTGCLAGLQLQDGRTSDRTEAQPTLPPGARRIADLGSWSVDAWHALDQQGSFWLSRLQPQTALDDTTGHRHDLWSGSRPRVLRQSTSRSCWAKRTVCRRDFAPCRSRRTWLLHAAASCGRRPAKKDARSVRGAWPWRRGHCS